MGRNRIDVGMIYVLPCFRMVDKREAILRPNTDTYRRTSLKCMVRRPDCKGKAKSGIDRSAQMYSAFVWRVETPGHDELRCVLFLVNGTVMEDHFREQVASTPLGTVRSS